MKSKSQVKKGAGKLKKGNGPFSGPLAKALQYESAGNWIAAKSIYRDVIRDSPDHAEANFKLASLLNQERQYALALEHWEKALRAGKTDLFARLGYGLCLFELQQPHKAIEQYRQAISLLGSEGRSLSALVKATVHYQCALVYQALDQLTEMEASLNRALKLSPDFAHAHNAMGYLHATFGRSAKARESYRSAIAVDPGFGEAHRGLAAEKKHAELDDEVRAMERVFASESTSDRDRIHIAFGLGKAFEDMQDYPQAFSYWKKGNDLYRDSHPYSVRKEVDEIHALRKVFDSAQIDWEQSGSDETIPVFVVGMMRSGSTLVEQILASHPDVFGAGETSLLLDVCKDAVDDFPAGLSRLSASDKMKIGRRYIEHMRKNSNGEHYVVDKMLTNYQMIGVIRMILPQAKVIHCRRDPMDLCLSAYKNLFGEGFSHVTYDLTDLGTLYRHYEKTMKHWHKIFPDFIFDIEYECLIENPEAEVKRLLDFIGLPFDKRCLAFYETKRAVKTASVGQVRQPIYKSSMRKWKKFEQELQSFKKAYKGRWFGL